MAYIVRRKNLGRGSCRGITAASTQGIKVIRNDFPTPQANWIFRWGCTSNLPQQDHIVNPSEGIHLVTDKIAFRKKLQEAGLCPKTWFTEQGVTFPCVVRPRVHSRGRKLYLCNNRNELLAAIRQCEGVFYASEYIKKDAEYRVFVAQGRAVWVTTKIPKNPDDIAWNVARGGKFENIHWDLWPLKAIKVAIAAFKLSGLDFGGVDVMVDGEGAVTVLEINSAPSQTSPYRQQCVAKVFDWIVLHGKDMIPMTEAKGGYKKFIHPALCPEAVIGA